MNKTALITGAARRLGKFMAIHLASQGWNIAIHYNSSDLEAIELREELRTQYPNQYFDIFKADLSQSNEVEKLFSQVISIYPNFELLINNASVFEPARITQTTIEFLENQMDVNFKAPFILMNNMAKTFRNGLIVNIIDTRITTNQSDYAAYSLSKKALWDLTQMGAVEFGPGIRVNAIAPGLTLPPENKDESYLWNLAEKIPLKRPGGINPILKSLDYIIDNEYLTGQILYCDGGQNLI